MGKAQRSYLAALVLCACLIAAPVTVAQTPPPTASPNDDKPVDIQANEQEFAGDTVIAKGKVKCTYKESIIIADQAKLFRTPDGQAQRAIFTGHPHLTQGESKMAADTLTFQIITGEIIADGHAHSEVEGGGGAPKDDGKTPDATTATATSTSTGTGSDDDNSDDSDQKTATTAAAATTSDSKKSAGAQTDTTASADGKKVIKPPPKSTKAEAPQMIVTDSDHQEYIKETGKFEASGHVFVKTGDIVVHSDKLQLMYGTDNKPEAALFNGNVNATQFDNNTISDKMTYFLSTQRLQATGNVRSKVIQKSDKKGGPSNGPKLSQGEIDPAALGDISDDQIICITADSQDYIRETGRVTAQGNVHLKYGDMSGFGPRVLILRKDDGTGKILFTGRSQINQPGKRWIGDRITLNMLDHKVLAEGNTRAFIVQNPPKPPAATTSVIGARLLKQAEAENKEKEAAEKALAAEAKAKQEQQGDRPNQQMLALPNGNLN